MRLEATTAPSHLPFWWVIEALTPNRDCHAVQMRSSTAGTLLVMVIVQFDRVTCPSATCPRPAAEIVQELDDALGGNDDAVTLALLVGDRSLDSEQGLPRGARPHLHRVAIT